MHRLGVDIGGTKMLAVALDDGGRVAAWSKVPTPRSASELVEGVLAVAAEVAASCSAGGRISLGVGCPGMIERSGRVSFAPHLHFLDGVDVAAALAARWPGPVSVSNDATCAGWAEYRMGAAAGRHTVLMVTLGTGIGGGIVTEGRLVTGANGYAGEFGHVVVEPHGPPCPCGKRGCWERFASGNGLGRLGREAAQAGLAPGLVARAGGDPEAVRGEHVTAAVGAGDEGAIGVMRRFAWWLALGLANLTDVLDPDAIVIGGGLVEAGPVLMDPARRAFAELVEGGEHRRVAIVPAALGERAGAIGAALIGARPG